MNVLERPAIVSVMISLAASNVTIFALAVLFESSTLGSLDIANVYSYLLPVAVTLGTHAGLLQRITRCHILSAALSLVSTWIGVVGSIVFPEAIEMKNAMIATGSVGIGLVFHLLLAPIARSRTLAWILSCMAMWIVATAFAFTQYFFHEADRADFLITSIGMGLLFQWIFIGTLYAIRALRCSVRK